MYLPQVDRIILHWTIQHDFDSRYVRAAGFAKPLLEITMTWTTVRFDAGKLVSLQPHDPGRCSDAFVYELARLFALCGYLESVKSGLVDETDREQTGNIATSCDVERYVSCSGPSHDSARSLCGRR